MSKTITLTDEQGAALQSGEPVTIEPAKKVGPDAELFAWLDRQADAREAMELAEAQRQSDECQRDLFDSTPAQSEHDEERIVSRQAAASEPAKKVGPDANLIAAAPDLYEALDQAVTSMQDSGYTNGHAAVIAAKSALSKARGAA